MQVCRSRQVATPPRRNPLNRRPRLRRQSRRVLVQNQTPGIVFPAWQDHAAPTGDTGRGRPTTNVDVLEQLVASPVIKSTSRREQVEQLSQQLNDSMSTSSASGNSSHESSRNGDCDNNCSSGDCDCGPKFSYSVSYFNWCVSEPSSEDECDQITVSLNRIKIRKTSRERNENLK